MNNIDGWKVVNLTAHDINIILQNGKVVEIENDWTFRVKEEVKTMGFVGGIRVIKKKFTGITYKDLEKLKEIINKNDVDIVSAISGKFVKELYEDGHLSREEANKVYIIGNTLRDDKGRVVGADALMNILYL